MGEVKGPLQTAVELGKGCPLYGRDRLLTFTLSITRSRAEFSSNKSRKMKSFLVFSSILCLALAQNPPVIPEAFLSRVSEKMQAP